LIGLSISQRWTLPPEWIANAIAAGADAPDPFNQEGMVTIAGVTFGFLAGFALWRAKFGAYTIKCSTAKNSALHRRGCWNPDLLFWFKFYFSSRTGFTWDVLQIHPLFFDRLLGDVLCPFGLQMVASGCIVIA